MVCKLNSSPLRAVKSNIGVPRVGSLLDIAAERLRQRYELLSCGRIVKVLGSPVG